TCWVTTHPLTRWSSSLGQPSSGISPSLARKAGSTSAASTAANGLSKRCTTWKRTAADSSERRSPGDASQLGAAGGHVLGPRLGTVARPAPSRRQIGDGGLDPG